MPSPVATRPIVMGSVGDTPTSSPADASGQEEPSDSKGESQAGERQHLSEHQPDDLATLGADGEAHPDLRVRAVTAYAITP